MKYRKIIINLPEETIKLLDLYRVVSGIARTITIETIVSKRTGENKEKIENGTIEFLLKE